MDKAKTRQEVRDRNLYEQNLLRSELTVMVLTAIINFKGVCVPGRKPKRNDVINVLSNIISNKTRLQ